MTIPVYIECQLVCLIQLPDTTSSKTLVTIFHVVGLHIYCCIFATGTIDTLPIRTTLSIKLHILHRLERKALRNLPIGMAINRHVTRVFYQELCLARIFCSCILPTIGMLQMEVGIAFQFADSDTQAIMLAKIAIATTSCGILYQKTLVVLLRNDIHHASNRIRAIERTRSTFHDFYLLNVLGIDKSQVVLSTYIAMNTLAINQYQDIVVAQAIQLHL